MEERRARPRCHSRKAKIYNSCKMYISKNIYSFETKTRNILFSTYVKLLLQHYNITRAALPVFKWDLFWQKALSVDCSYSRLYSINRHLSIVENKKVLSCNLLPQCLYGVLQDRPILFVLLFWTDGLNIITKHLAL